MKKITCIFFLLSAYFSFSQNEETLKGLYKKLKTNNNDTVRIKTLNSISSEYRENNNDSALKYALLALDLAKTTGYVKGQWNAYNNLGEISRFLGRNEEAIKYHQTALGISEKLANKTLLAHSYNNLAIVLKTIRNYTLAETYFLLSLKAYTEVGDSGGYYSSLNNMGNLYYNQKLHKKSYIYFLKGYQTSVELKDSSLTSQALNNLGNALYYLNKKDSSTFCYEKGFKMALKHASKREIVNCGVNLAYMYYENGDFQKSENLYKEMSVLVYKLNDKSELAVLYSYLAELYHAWKKDDLAYLYKDSATAVNEEVWYKKNLESINRLTAVYENEKKELQIKNLSSENEAKNEKIKSENRFKIIFAIGFIVLGIFAVYLFYNLKEKERSRKIIDKQKSDLEEKQKEILDSIHYAKRIQQALLPNEKYIEKSINKLQNKNEKA